MYDFFLNGRAEERGVLDGAGMAGSFVHAALWLVGKLLETTRASLGSPWVLPPAAAVVRRSRARAQVFPLDQL